MGIRALGEGEGAPNGQFWLGKGQRDRLSEGNELKKYFSRFPLLSSKHLDYINWVESHELVPKNIKQLKELLS